MGELARGLVARIRCGAETGAADLSRHAAVGGEATTSFRRCATAGIVELRGLAIGAEDGALLGTGVHHHIGVVGGALRQVGEDGTRAGIAGRNTAQARAGAAERVAGVAVLREELAAARIDPGLELIVRHRDPGLHAGGTVIFRCRFQMQTAAHQAGTRRHLQHSGGIVAIGRKTARGVQLKAFEALVGHEVDHTGDGVRTPGRRRTAGHNVDTLDQKLRHLRDVDGTVRVGRHHALAVQQNQGADNAKAAQVQRRQAGQTRGGRTGVIGNARRTFQGGQLGHRFEDVGLGSLFQVRRAHHRGRRRRVKTGILQTGRRYDHLLHTRSRALRHRSAGAQRQHGHAACQAHASRRQSVNHQVFPPKGCSTGLAQLGFETDIQGNGNLYAPWYIGVLLHSSDAWQPQLIRAAIYFRAYLRWHMGAKSAQ